jgi:hypothetical protein
MHVCMYVCMYVCMCTFVVKVCNFWNTVRPIEALPRGGEKELYVRMYACMYVFMYVRL